MRLMPLEEFIKSGHKIMIDADAITQRIEWWEYQDVIVLTADPQGSYQLKRGPEPASLFPPGHQEEDGTCPA